MHICPGDSPVTCLVSSSLVGVPMADYSLQSMWC